VDRQYRRLEGLENSDKPAGAYRLLDLIRQNSRDAPPVRCSVDGNLHLVDLEARLELHGLGLGVASLESPLNIAGLWGDRDDLVAGQCLGGIGRAGPLQIVGARDHDAANGSETAGDERRLRKLSDAQGEIDAVLQQIDEPVRQAEFDPRRAIGVEIGVDERHDMHPAEQPRRRDPEPPGRDSGLTGNVPDSVLEIGQDATQMLREAHSGIGQRQLAGRALKQANAESRLELTDRPAGSGGRLSDAAGGGGERPVVDDRKEQRQGIDAIHCFKIRNSHLQRWAIISKHRAIYVQEDVSPTAWCAIPMNHSKNFTSDVAFTPAVKAAQARKGSRHSYRRLEERDAWKSTVTPELAAFIAAQTSAFLATASLQGQPYVQHRGGPAGFLKVLDARTIGFADYTGNRQYITLGNLSENPKAQLFLIDYATRRRIKIWGEARVVEGDRELTAKLMPVGYQARPEQVILFTVSAFDVNCSQHIPQRFEAADVAEALAKRDRRIAELEAEIARTAREAQ